MVGETQTISFFDCVSCIEIVLDLSQNLGMWELLPQKLNHEKSRTIHTCGNYYILLLAT
ncbi:hypothetical protein LEP1GSC070_3875 [Leptospira santarosai str. AIM]|nr:hypothetical protein LEP1GSC070_3875 [Leptospira santarosai str. AIM]